MKVKLINLKYHSKIDQFITKTLKEQFVIISEELIESFGGDINGAYPLVISQDPDYRNENALIFSNIEDALHYVHAAELSVAYFLDDEELDSPVYKEINTIITMDPTPPEGWFKVHEEVQFGNKIFHYMKGKINISKNICFFNTNRAWGGGEKWHFNTAKFFMGLGHKVLVITNIRSELEKKSLAEKLSTFSFYVHNLSFLNPFKILSVMTLFKENKTEAVIMNLPSDLKLGGIAAKLCGVKKIIYRRGMPHPIRDTILNRFLFRNVLTDIIVNSEEIGRSLTQGNESWFPKEKIRLIYNGVDTTKAIELSRKMYQKQGDEIILGNAGRLTGQKGQKYLIELASLMKDKNINFKLLIAGMGELEAELKDLIKEHDLEDEVKLLGHVEDMPAFFNSLDAFVFTSLYEGSANTLIETLQYQVPTVAWDISSNPEIIQHQVTGYLAKPFEIEDLYKGVEYVLKRTTVDAGSELVKQKFDTNKNLEVLKHILES